jgi:hypothetical protein
MKGATGQGSAYLAEHDMLAIEMRCTIEQDVELRARTHTVQAE